MNLDNSHQAVQDAHQMTKAELEDSILYNETNFGLWAKRYVMAINRTESFLRWCWKRYKSDHTPANKSWMREAKEYEERMTQEIKVRPQEYNAEHTPAHTEAWRNNNEMP